MTIFNTRGLVLRVVKYGETSVIVTMLTSLFGIRSYMVNGVRTAKKSRMAHFFQPAALLELQVYNHELRNLQRIKEVGWAYLYRNVFCDVVQNTVAQYMVELLTRSVTEPEGNEWLFDFSMEALIQLDTAHGKIVANFPLFFAARLPHFLGFEITNNYTEETPLFAIREGKFIAIPAVPVECATEMQSIWIHEILSAHQPQNLDLPLNRDSRRQLLDVLHAFYRWHVPGMGNMKTPSILTQIL